MFSRDNAEGPVCAVVGLSASSLHGAALQVMCCETRPVHDVCLCGPVSTSELDFNLL